jgi:hypothetical protein
MTCPGGSPERRVAHLNGLDRTLNRMEPVVARLRFRPRGLIRAIGLVLAARSARIQAANKPDLLWGHCGPPTVL